MPEEQDGKKHRDAREKTGAVGRPAAPADIKEHDFPAGTARGAKGLSPDLVDDQLREQVQSVLDADPRVGSYALKADVVEREAQIHGIVDTLSEKQRAEDIAHRVPGIVKVDSAVAVSTDGPITDKGVEFEVSEELQAHPGVNTKNIGAKVERGAVTLVGSTDDPAEVEAARKAASRARGVTKVTSQVKIRNKGEMTGEEIFHSQVRNDREKNPRHDGDDVLAT